ncbi:MAG: hypothetical protein WBM68_07870 [Woeseia sp.]
MMRTFLLWLNVAWAMLLLSSLVSMMAVFMGSGSQDLGGLLAFQIFTLPLAAAAMGWHLFCAARAAAEESALLLLWRSIPGWLVFVVCMAASLTLISELTMTLIELHTDAARPWQERIPAICAVAYALALALGYGSLQIANRR